MEGHKLTLTVTPFSGFSGSYTVDVMEKVETEIRRILDENIGYLNDAHERNYEIVREDWDETADSPRA